MKDNQFDHILKETIKEDYENIPAPLKSKTDTWSDIQKELMMNEQPKGLFGKGVKKATLAASCVLILLMTVFSQSESSTAFGWLSRLFFNIDENNQANISGSLGTPMDQNAPPPPPSPSEDFQVIEIETTEKIMSLSEAQEITDFEILVPKKVPTQFGPPSVKVFYANDQVDDKVELQYYHNEESFTIKEYYVRHQMGYGYGADLDDTKVQEIMIHGQKGVLFSYKDGDKRLVWDYLDYHLELNGRLSEEQVIEIARSM